MSTNGISAGPRALTAADAGKHLAELLGLGSPISRQRMWQLARAGRIPTVRLGRRVWFQLGALEALVRNGGTTRSDA